MVFEGFAKDGLYSVGDGLCSVGKGLASAGTDMKKGMVEIKEMKVIVKPEFPDLFVRMGLVSAGVMLGSSIASDKYIGTTAGVAGAVSVEAAARAWMNYREARKKVQARSSEEFQKK